MDIKDFGSRLRQERLKAGLSQSDLASGIMSPSHISLLESGQRSPSPELLEQLAERLGVTPKYLSSGPSAQAAESRRKDLLFAEMALKNGDTESAERLLRSLVTELDSTTSIEFAVRARHVYARALEGLGRLEKAASELRQAIGEAQFAGLPLEAVEMTITLSSLARESGDFVTALELLTSAQHSFPHELRQMPDFFQVRLAFTISAETISVRSSWPNRRWKSSMTGQIQPLAPRSSGMQAWLQMQTMIRPERSCLRSERPGFIQRATIADLKVN
jgi:transcriptional regulator with XRE-family HTH domain